MCSQADIDNRQSRIKKMADGVEKVSLEMADGKSLHDVNVGRELEDRCKSLLKPFICLNLSSRSRKLS